MQKRFTDIFILRPVFAICISLVVLLTGLVCYSKMDVRQYPRLDASVVQIIVTYPGANSEVMEGYVTTPIEGAISVVDGLDYITSQSTQGQSKINVFMKLGYDINAALTDVSTQVASVRNQLPPDINDPVITKTDPTAMPLLLLNVTSSKLSDEQLSDYLVRAVQPQIQMQNGVNSAQILGERVYSMRIWLDPQLMAAHNVTANDINNTINAQNIIAPAGALKAPQQIFNLYSSTDLNNPKQFNNMIIRNDNGQLVKIKDIGQAILGAQNTDFSVFANDKSSTFMNVIAKSNANPLDVVKEVTKLLTQIRSRLPEGMTITDFFDSTKFIIVSLEEVAKTIFEACIFVFLVIFFMLGSFRAVFVPLVTIPLSLAGACIIMLAMGFSINILTLLAFVLAIGLVVDDAIVVLENVHRHLEVGLTPKQAALIGAREISFAVIAMTLTLAAVYMPIGFMSGLAGKLFTEFAFTLAGSVIVSGFIALTLSPMMCSKIYRANENFHAGLPGFIDRNFSKVRNGYKKVLRNIIKKRYFVALFALLVYASCYFLAKGLQTELAPDEDTGSIFGIVYAPATTNLDYTQGQTKKLADIYRAIPEKENYLVVNGYPSGVNSAFSVLVLKDWSQRKRTAMQIRDQLLGQMWAIPGVLAFPSIPSSLPGAGGYTPVQFVINTVGDYVSLEKNTIKFIDELQKWGGVANINRDLKIDQAQVDINIDYNKAGILGIKMSDIAQSLNTFLSMPQNNYFIMNGYSYQVLPQLYRKYRDIPDALNNLNLKTASGDLVPLSNFVTLKEEIIPESRNHFQQLRSTTITANLTPGVSLGTALKYMNTLAKQVFPENASIDYSGPSRQLMQGSGSTGQLFLFALIFIYLVLAAQFESFRDPFIVMLTVPLAIAGALAGLYLCKGTLNIYTQIGLVTLVGLITKNGILIVEFANQQQERGMAFHRAIIEAASQRLRPILMTTFAMILGALPLAMATGAGAVSRAQMGFVIVFGISFGTLLTLFVVPSAYYMFATRIKGRSEKELEEVKALERIE